MMAIKRLSSVVQEISLDMNKSLVCFESDSPHSSCVDNQMSLFHCTGNLVGYELDSVCFGSDNPWSSHGGLHTSCSYRVVSDSLIRDTEVTLSKTLGFAQIDNMLQTASSSQLIHKTLPAFHSHMKKMVQRIMLNSLEKEGGLAKVRSSPLNPIKRRRGLKPS